MLIASTQSQFFGQKIKLPEIGIVDLNEKGEIEVEDSIAELLLDGDGWEVVGGEVVGGETEPATPAKVKKPKTKPAAAPATTEIESEMEAEINKMTLEELQALAKQSNIKNWHLFKNKPEVLRNYIKNQLKSV